MQDEVSLINRLLDWLTANAAWFVPLMGFFMATLWRIHRYFTGLNRLAEAVDKLTDPEKGVMMKKDVEAKIEPVLRSVYLIETRINSLEEWSRCRPHNQRHTDR